MAGGFRGAVLLLLVACARHPEPQQAAAAPVPPPSPPAAPAPPGPAASSEPLLGVVLASEEVLIRAPFEGRLERIGVRPGERLQQGAVLATMEVEALRSQERMEQALLQQAEASLIQAEMEANEATERHQRYAKTPPGTLSADELGAAKYEAKRAQAAVSAARAGIRERRAALAGIRERLRDAELRAPFDCVVSVRYLDPGARVQAGTPILRLIRNGEFRVRFALPEARSGMASAGLPVDILLPALGKVLPGTIENIAPEVDPASRMVFAMARLLSSHDAVRAGMVARVSLGGGFNPAVAPSSDGPPGRRNGE